MARDDALRAACFLALDALRAQHGDEVPYRGGLDRGFVFSGTRVPFLSTQKGIFRAAAQSGPGALSVNTSANSPYDDEAVVDGFRYAYRRGAIDQADNRALRAAFALQVPMAYFFATRPRHYLALYPVFVVEDDPADGHVLLSGVVDPPPESGRGLADRLPADLLVRRYQTRATKTRVHQGRFRGRVLPAYGYRCTVCRLKETRLLDAAHIVGDREEGGDPVVQNGLSLCSIHHRAFDGNLIGVSPDYEVHVHERLLDEQDGPMLDLLKGAHRSAIILPRSVTLRPDRERLAVRFDRFRAST